MSEAAVAVEDTRPTTASGNNNPGDSRIKGAGANPDEGSDKGEDESSQSG